MHLVFVYGTLRKGGTNHHIINGARCIEGNASTTGFLYDTIFGYPYMAEAGEGTVFGELYEVNDQMLQTLDVLEDYHGPGCDNLYERVLMEIQTSAGPQKALVYVLPKGRPFDELKHVESGDWIIHLSTAKNKPDGAS